MDARKQLIALGIVIIFLLVANELRFVMWGPYGLPKLPSQPNCGEERHMFNMKVNSEMEFLDAIKNFSVMAEEDAGYNVTQWLQGEYEYNLTDVKTRNSLSLFSSQKLYSVSIKYPECSGLVFEMAGNGYAYLRGCCSQ
jgi:hypothetical protein